MIIQPGTRCLIQGCEHEPVTPWGYWCPLHWTKEREQLTRVMRELDVIAEGYKGDVAQLEPDAERHREARTGRIEHNLSRRKLPESDDELLAVIARERALHPELKRARQWQPHVAGLYGAGDSALRTRLAKIRRRGLL